MRAICDAPAQIALFCLVPNLVQQFARVAVESRLTADHLIGDFVDIFPLQHGQTADVTAFHRFIDIGGAAGQVIDMASPRSHGSPLP